MKRKIWILFTALIIAAVSCYAASAADYELDGIGEFSTSDECDFWETGDFTRVEVEGVKGIMQEVCGIDNGYVYSKLYYIKYGDSCSSEMGSFSGMKGATKFMDSYGDGILSIARDSTDLGWDMDYTIQMSDVIKGKSGSFVKNDIIYETGFKDSMYIAHLRDNIYCVFYAEGVYSYDEDAAEEKDYLKALENFDEVVATYSDAGGLERFLKKAEKKSVWERISGTKKSDGAGFDLSNTAGIILILLIDLFFLVMVIRLVFKKRKMNFTFRIPRGDQKKVTRTVDGTTTTSVHCTYEDSLKVLRDSGLLTAKEYKEMLEKHNR